MQNFDATGGARTGYGKSHEIAPTFFLSLTSHLRYRFWPIPQVAEKYV